MLFLFKTIAEPSVIMQKVNSSAIEKIGYQNNELFIKFITGKMYIYNGVPTNIYNKFINAESKGKFFINNIKDRYNYQKV